MTTPAGMSRRSSWLVTAACLLFTVGVVLFATDLPLPPGPGRAEGVKRAAFAIRDKVPAFQQWGTRSFTVPCLEAGYANVDYVTITGAAADQRDDCVRRLTALLQAHDAVDLFLLAHSNAFVDWVAAVDASLRSRLRLVYNTGCFDLRQRQQWIDVGARAYVGHVGLSESPIFYVFFLRRWLRGGSLGEVVSTSNERTAAVLGRLTPSLQWNTRATVASTFAEVTGDASLRLDGGRP